MLYSNRSSLASLSNFRLSSSIFFPSAGDFKLHIYTNFVSFHSSPTLYPMFTAVSILSPVAIATPMPAARRSMIVLQTFSCNLSSTATHPINEQLRSIL